MFGREKDRKKVSECVAPSEEMVKEVGKFLVDVVLIGAESHHLVEVAEDQSCGNAWCVTQKGWDIEVKRHDWFSI